jgi:HPt (histidine-containing phosphotransfer) domain-containing protein
MADKLYNLIKLDEIAQGDENFIHDMVVTFVENVAIDIKSVRELKSSENWTAVAEIAHKLASNYAYLGSEHLHILAVHIEKSVLNDKNLVGILEKAEQMCSGSDLLINELKKDFNISDVV